MAYNAHLAYYYEKQPELEDLLTSLSALAAENRFDHVLFPHPHAHPAALSSSALPVPRSP